MVPVLCADTRSVREHEKGQMSANLSDYPPAVQRRILAQLDKQPAITSMLPDPVKVAANERKLERKIQEEIAAFLRLRGIVFFQQRMDRKTTGTKGWVDFTFSCHGLDGRRWPIGCEAKRPGEHPTDEQSKMHERMRKNGWLVMVAYSMEDVRRLIDSL